MAVTGRRPTGGWHYELNPAQGREHLPEVTAISAQILGESELLLPRRLVLSNWIRPMGETFEPGGAGAVEIPVGPALSAAEIARAITRADTGDEQAIPGIGVRGDTIVVEPGSQPRVEADLLTLDAVYDGVGITVHLTTYGTMWLAFDLAGRPQEALAAGNAPRLAHALHRLAVRLDAEVHPGAPTRYAVPTPHGLDNHRYVDGEIASVDAS